MHIMPINFNFHNSKIKKNINNSKLISNHIQTYQNYTQTPFEHLETFNQINQILNYKMCIKTASIKKLSFDTIPTPCKDNVFT